MSAYESRFYASADGLNLFYRDYRGGDGPLTPVLCIPGLTRNARDFDFIAGHIDRSRRVLVADLRGRGLSAHDPEWRHYTVPVEAADMLRLLEDAGVPQAVILGTSRGGIVAMAMAVTKPEAIRAVILNDIGSEIEDEGLSRILEFVGRETAFTRWEDAAGALKQTYEARFPGLPETKWREFAHAVYRMADGRIVPDYDLNLGNAMRDKGSAERAQGANVNLWPLFAGLSAIPTLLLRGENSDLLSTSTVEKMREAKPDLIAVTVKGRGHVPFLDEAEAVEAIDDFLSRLD